MALDQQTQQAIAAQFLYLRDLGIHSFYRRQPAAGALPEEEPLEVESGVEDNPTTARHDPAPLPDPALGIAGPISKEAVIPRVPFPAQPPVAPPVAPEAHAQALEEIRKDLGDCHRCALAAGRHSIVFGGGNPNARLMFVGEAPGADEDAQGLPFVGRAGKLLNNMIRAMGMTREEVYVANVVKCRPPQNRVPLPEEAHACMPFLFRQIDVIRPEVIVALGSTAALYLLGVRSSLAALRGRVHSCRGSKLIVTYHPAYLLRDPRQKKEAWRDLQLVMAELGLTPPTH